MNRTAPPDEFAPASGALKPLLLAVGVAVYAAIAALATLIYPLALAVFAAPLVFAIAIAAPQARPAPRRLALGLIYAAAVLLPLWPVYLHLKLGPAPILTPPRIALYALTAVWLYDMVSSRIRRGQFLLTLKRGRLIAWPALGMFVLGALSLPLAEGRMLAGAEFFRQSIIWLGPLLAVMTYIRKPRELRRVAALVAISGGVSGAIAMIELTSGRLMASVLSPFIPDDAEWLRKAQAQKIRDGVFRAQGPHTHPLSLGELLALSAPLALGFFVGARMMFSRFFWAACLLATIGGALATNSRGALLAICVSLAVAAVLLALRALASPAAWRFRPAAALVACLALLASPVIGAAANHMVSGGAGASAARSTQSRLDQIEMAAPKISQRPVLGYGTGRAARVLGYWGTTLTIDNYYLSLALDYGLPGPAAFISMLIGVIVFSLDRARRAPAGEAALWIGFSAMAASLMLTRAIVSMTGNIAIFYLLFAAIAGASRSSRPSAARRGGAELLP